MRYRKDRTVIVMTLVGGVVGIALGLLVVVRFLTNEPPADVVAWTLILFLAVLAMASAIIKKIIRG